MRLPDWSESEVRKHRALWEETRLLKGDEAFGGLASVLSTQAGNPIPPNLLRKLNGSHYRGNAYRTFAMPKRRGGERRIDVPSARLKWAQRSILQVFTHLFPRHRCAKAFERGIGVVSHARVHLARRIVITMDLRDFFPSITWERVYGALQTFPFDAGRDVARILANLMTYRGALPQGAPSSPIMANLICRRMDSRLHAWATEGGFRYSRYADDLAFSTNHWQIPRGTLRTIGARVSKEGFTVHPKKTRVMYRSERQVVTGIVVNNKTPALPVQYRRNLRALLHNVLTNDWASQVGRTAIFASPEEYTHYLQGGMTRQGAKFLQRQQAASKLLMDPRSVIPAAIDVHSLMRVVAGRVAFVGQVYGGGAPYSKLSRMLERAMSRQPGARQRIHQAVRGHVDAMAEAMFPRERLYLRCARAENASEMTRAIAHNGERCLELLWLRSQGIESNEDLKHARRLAFSNQSDPSLTGRFLAAFYHAARDLLHRPTGQVAPTLELVRNARNVHDQWSLFLPNSAKDLVDDFLNASHQWAEQHSGHPWDDDLFRTEVIERFKRRIRFAPGGSEEIDLTQQLQDFWDRHLHAWHGQRELTVEDIRLRVFCFAHFILPAIKLTLESMVSNTLASQIVVEAARERPVDGLSLIRIRVRDVGGRVAVPADPLQMFGTKLRKAVSSLRGLADWELTATFADGRHYVCKVMDNTKTEVTTVPSGVEHCLTIYEFDQ